MTLQILKDNYPKSLELLKDWILQIIKQTPGITPEFIPKAPIDMLIELLLSNSDSQRQLYEWFDANQLILCVLHQNKKWIYNINGTEYPDNYPNRIATEKQGFIDCFQLLEQKL